MTTMTSNKPYVLRAYYDWIVDNSLTPYLLVNAEYPNMDIPLEHVNNGRILLNISPTACRGLHLDNDKILFTTRFSGVATQVFIYPAAVLAIYAKENGEGIEFPLEEGDGGDGIPPTTPGPQTTKTKPTLKLVK